MIDLIVIVPRWDLRGPLPSFWDDKTYGASVKFFSPLEALKWVHDQLASTSISSFDMEVNQYREADLPYLLIMDNPQQPTKQQPNDLERISQ